MSHPPQPPQHGPGLTPVPPGGHPPHPQGNTPGYGPGPAGPPPRSSAATPIIIAVVVAVVLALGGGIFLFALNSDDDSQEGGDSASAPEARLLHQVAMPKVPELTNTQGLWTTDKNVVKADVNKIVGYPLAGGAPQWEVALSGEICWSTAQPTDDGLIAVLFEDATQDPSVCTQVGLVDLTTGKLRWQKESLQGEAGYTSPMMFDEVTIGGGTVAAGGISGGSAWSLAGKELWKPEEDAECDDRGYAGGADKLIAVQQCGDSDQPSLTVQTVDPSTRKVRSTFELAAGTAEYVHVASVDPLVIAVDTGEGESGTGVTYFQAVDDSAPKGTPLAKIDMLGENYQPNCPATNVYGCTEMAVSKQAGSGRTGTLLVPSDRSGGSGYGNQVVAFDLKTGKSTGETELGEKIGHFPIGVDEQGSVLVYQEPSYSEGGAVWKVDPATLKGTKVFQNPAESAETESGFESDGRFHFAQGRLYIGDDYARNLEEYTNKDRPLLMIFGAK